MKATQERYDALVMGTFEAWCKLTGREQAVFLPERNYQREIFELAQAQQSELEQLRVWQKQARRLLEAFLSREDHQGSYCWWCSEFDNKHKPDCERIIGRALLVDVDKTVDNPAEM